MQPRFHKCNQQPRTSWAGAVLNDPAAHGVHVPTRLQYVPTGHGVQADSPVVSPIVPFAQAEHDVADWYKGATGLLNVETGQTMQSSAAVLFSN